MQSKFIFKKDGWIISVILFVHILCWFSLKPIPPHSDDLCYYLDAKKILNHEFAITESPKDHRFGVIIPAMILTKLFGDSPYIISLWSLLCSLLTIFMVYLFLIHNLDRTTALLASLLLATNLIQVIYSTVLFPDIIVSFFALSCIISVYYGRKIPEADMKASIVFILFFIGGFITKETVVLILPFIILISLSDLKNKFYVSFWKKFSIVFFTAIVFLLLISKIVYHDFLFFYHIVEKNHNEVFVAQLDSIGILKRITYEPLLWINDQFGYVFLFIFSLPSLFHGLKRKDNFQNTESFISFYFLILLLTFWIGTSSFTRFAPILLLDRMWMILTAPLCILSAFTIKRLSNNENAQKELIFLITALLILALINFYQVSFWRSIIYVLFIIALAVQKVIRSRILKSILIVLPFLILTVYFLLKNSNYVIQ